MQVDLQLNLHNQEYRDHLDLVLQAERVLQHKEDKTQVVAVAVELVELDNLQEVMVMEITLELVAQEVTEGLEKLPL
jgi:hypothetical protein